MTDLNLQEMKALMYQRPKIDRGYAGQTLHIDLADQEITMAR